jgi:propionate CoA-transferase
VRIPLQTLDTLELDERKVIARRAALELAPNSIINLGIGLPDCVGTVAGEERLQDLITLTVDPGIIGGVPMGGLDFGAAVNCQAVIDHGSQFDFIDGGGLDAAYLGMAEADRYGNVNASRFGRRLTGCGGFINISQNSQKVIFLSTFSSSGLKVQISDGKIRVLEEGKIPKFVDRVGQITFSGRYAAESDQEVLYITERCVFKLTDAGLELIEIAPGIDLERDILAKMPFTPLIREPMGMEASIFRPEPMELRDRLLDIHIEDRISYDAEKNTLFLDFAGMRVRNEADLAAIKKAVDATLEPLGKRVYSIVNYERFVADDDIVDKYMDLVKYVEDKYYISVSRYTSSGFLRLKLGKELGKRKVSSRIYESSQEAELHLTDK